MRLTIVAIGSRGDVQPYVALGMGFRDAGHEVTIAAFPFYEALVRERGLEFAPITFKEPGEARRRRRGIFSWWVSASLREARSVAARRLADCRDACEEAEAIVVSNFGTLLGYHVAESMHVPLIRAYYTPVETALGHVPQPGSAPRGLAAKASEARYRVIRQLAWLFSRRWVNAARRDVLGLPPLPVRQLYDELDSHRVPLLYGYSPSVFRPAEAGDWMHVTGQWFLERPEDWEPPAALVEFLEAGPPPVYVGFGGASFHDPEETTAIVAEALSKAGRRGILGQPPPPAGAPSLPPEILAIDSVWHDWLFPRLAAAVHHGGAGTTAAALRAGIPSVIVPVFADQPFWASRVRELRVGPPPIPRRHLSADRLARAIETATSDAEMRERASAFAERIRSEDGVARAVDAFERGVAARPPRVRSGGGVAAGAYAHATSGGPWSS